MDVREAAIILGVAQDATIDQVREAYRSHARLLHPDRLGEASEKDRATAHEAMARINDAYAVFQARLRVSGGDQQSRPPTPQNTGGPSDRSRPKPPAASAHQQPREDRRIAQFDALLSHPRGWDLTGVLRIIRTYGATYGSEGRVSAVFESDDLDARGNPVFGEEVFVAKGVRALSEGTLALRGGGNLVLMGGRWEAERVLSLLGLDPALAHPRRRSNRRVLLFAGAGIIALIASLVVVAALAYGGRDDPAPTAGAPSSASTSPVSEDPSPPGETFVTGASGSSSASLPNRTRVWEVGETGPGGGIVFYDAGGERPWGRYLEVAPSDWFKPSGDPVFEWCDKLLPPTATGTALGDGAANTAAMVGSCSTGAGVAAHGYRGGGLSDWYLPSKDELAALYDVYETLINNGTGGIWLSGFYWSSSLSAEDGDPWSQSFGVWGEQRTWSNDFATSVRPIRAF